MRIKVARQLSSDIWLFENSFSLDLCNRLITWFEQPAISKKTYAQFERGEKVGVALDPSLSLTPEDSKAVLQAKANISTVLLRYYRTFDTLYTIQTEKLELRGQIIRYGVGSRYDRHTDTDQMTSMTIITYLNDGFTGGETLFPRQSVSVEPSKGSTIIFPGVFTHPHAGLEVLTGYKYIMQQGIVIQIAR